MVEEGKAAPDFELHSDTGDTVKLSDLRGKPVVLYFYPKDDTPGCTAQACGIRDAWGEFESRGAVVLGVSPDDEKLTRQVQGEVRPAVHPARRHRSPDSRGLRRLGREELRRQDVHGRRALDLRDRRGRQRREGAAAGEAGHPCRRRAGGVALPAVAIALPPQLAAAIERLVAEAGGSVEAEVERLSAAYRGEDRARAASSRAAVAAYLAYRAPATFAAAAAVFRQVQRQRPDWTPRSLLDVGAGPGVAAWAAVAAWPSLEQLTLVEAEPEMIAAGRELTPGAHWVQADVTAAPGPADLVLVSYVLGELHKPVSLPLWEQTADTIVFVEPGTPAGYRRILDARDAVIEAGGHTVAPCPHDLACPLPEDDWCHFGVRLPRSKLHRRAKGVELGYEDEKYSYAVLSREPVAKASARIIRQPQVRSGHVILVDVRARRDRATNGQSEARRALQGGERRRLG